MKRVIGVICQWCAIVCTVFMLAAIFVLAFIGSHVSGRTSLVIVGGGIVASMLFAFLAWLCGIEETMPPGADDDSSPPTI